MGFKQGFVGQKSNSLLFLLLLAGPDGGGLGGGGEAVSANKGLLNGTSSKKTFIIIHKRSF